jgi:signal transduction histidine kinase
MLELVIRNLLSNAWRYTATAADPHINLTGRQNVFQVSDNGAGFDMTHADKLFKPFQRLHRQDEFPGIGIGLSTVHRIVQRHGGTIHAEGVVGGGATFRVTLPGPGGGPKEDPSDEA